MYQKPFPHPRAGITVIEVLTSIIVALIGVAGVLVMIPFAVGQAEIGFDQEASYRHGANLAEEFDIKGFSNSNRWSLDVGTVGLRTSRNYVIDPIGVAQRVENTQTYGYFPFVSPALETAVATAANNAFAPPFASADKTILIERTNLFGSTALPVVPMTTGLARHHFSWKNDLQTAEPELTAAVAAGYASTDLAPPQQVFDVNGTNTAVKRQSRGEMSGMVLTVPADVISNSPLNPPGSESLYPVANPDASASDRTYEFRNYFLAFKNRPRPVEYAGASLHPYDRVYQLEPPYLTYNPDPDGISANGFQNWQARMLFSGGTVKLREPVALANNNSLSTQRGDVRRGDWIMLTNVTFRRNENRFFQQVNFYQVVDATIDSDASGSFWQVTLQGPDFDMGWHLIDDMPPSGVNQDYATFTDFAAWTRTTGGVTESFPSKTYAVHLPDLWAVFEKTFR